jgi:hypothetical protein
MNPTLEPQLHRTVTLYLSPGTLNLRINLTMNLTMHLTMILTLKLTLNLDMPSESDRGPENDAEFTRALPSAESSSTGRVMRSLANVALPVLGGGPARPE